MDRCSVCGFKIDEHEGDPGRKAFRCEACGALVCGDHAAPLYNCVREQPKWLCPTHYQQVKDYIEGLKQPELHWSVFEQGGMFTVSTNCPLPDNANDFFELPRDAVMAVCEHIKSGLKRTEYHPRNEGLKPKVKVWRECDFYKIIGREDDGKPIFCHLRDDCAEALYSYMKAEREG